ncbi:MAG: glycoside hydrolase family 27 protein [Clostridia bacterium]|nr:glycoside hydrolase family 27 protein [Clostridia bacterium]
MLAKTPPMGFNTWNTFGSEINEALIRESADAMVDQGLPQAGYEYLVIDDCWSEYLRDPVTQRLVAHHEKFPNGMKAVGDYVHSKGLKFGMYSCCGVRTCGDYPASFDHEFLDAQTFAEFGVDYLKYDNCYHPLSVDGPTLYRRMGMALRATGREILFSACNWGSEDVWSWIRSTGAHMYRSTGDIFDNAQSYRSIAISQMEKLGASAPGCFNDLDMLTVGMYGKGLVGTSGCGDADYRSQFALWCMFSSPLMLGCDVRKMTPFIHSLVTNPRLIAIDQDEEARPPIFFHHRYGEHDDDRIVCLKFLADGRYALGFFNFAEEERELFMMFADGGLTASSGLGLRLQDAFTGEDAGFYREYYRVKVPAHDCAVYLGTLEKA